MSSRNSSSLRSCCSSHTSRGSTSRSKSSGSLDLRGAAATNVPNDSVCNIDKLRHCKDNPLLSTMWVQFCALHVCFTCFAHPRSYQHKCHVPHVLEVLLDTSDDHLAIYLFPDPCPKSHVPHSEAHWHAKSMAMLHCASNCRCGSKPVSSKQKEKTFENSLIPCLILQMTWCLGLAQEVLLLFLGSYLTA